MLIVVGLSHRTAPIELRERLAFDDIDRRSLLSKMVGFEGVDEAMVLGTCNRVELFGVVADSGDPSQGTMLLSELLEERCPGIRRCLYIYEGREALRHLFRVAASLESLVIGEPQILGQVKSAFETAKQAGTIGAQLHHAVTRALRTAKRVRSETQLGAGQVSVPSVAIDLAGEIFEDLSGLEVLLIGAGEMAESVARLLTQQGATLTVLGRNLSRTEELAHRYGGNGKSLDELEMYLGKADVVVSSTSAPHLIVSRAMVQTAMRQRRSRDLFFIDLAVPRDIEPSVVDLDGVYLYNIDDLSAVVARSLDERALEAEGAEKIVEQQLEGLERWYEAEQVTPFLVKWRARVSELMELELKRSLRGRLKHLSLEDQSALQKMLESTVNQLLHLPTVELRKIAVDSPTELDSALALINQIFGLEQPISSSLSSRPPSLPPESERHT